MGWNLKKLRKKSNQETKWHENFNKTNETKEIKMAKEKFQKKIVPI